MSDNRIEYAKQILERAGYTVTPPPEKEKGKVVVYRNNQGEIWAIPKEYWDKYPLWHKDNCTTIAIVDWEEGQGL